MRVCNVSAGKMMEIKFETLQNPPYSPDMPPSNFSRFLTWCKQQRANILMLILKNFRKRSFLRLKKFGNSLEKCIELKGVYDDKLKRNTKKVNFSLFPKTYWTALVLLSSPISRLNNVINSWLTLLCIYSLVVMWLCFNRKVKFKVTWYDVADRNSSCKTGHVDSPRSFHGPPIRYHRQTY